MFKALFLNIFQGFGMCYLGKSYFVGAIWKNTKFESSFDNLQLCKFNFQMGESWAALPKYLNGIELFFVRSIIIFKNDFYLTKRQITKIVTVYF